MSVSFSSPRRVRHAVVAVAVAASSLVSSVFLSDATAIAQSDPSAPAPVDSPALKPSRTSSDGTFAGAFTLPQRWNDDYKPGTRCTPPGSTAKYLTAKNRWFKQTDAASVANRNDHAVPVTQKVVNERVQTTEVSGSVEPTGELAKLLNHTYGFSYVFGSYWRTTETVGPYQLGPNKQGKLVWGFTILDADVQDVRCSEDLVWEPVGSPYKVSVPEGRYSELRIDDAPVFG